MAINSQIKLAGQMPSINALNLANKIHGQEDIIILCGFECSRLAGH